jgi:PAS domain S-box-containing protein
MAGKTGSKKPAGGTGRKIDAVDKDKLIAELNNKILLLEKELRLMQDDTTSQEITERKRAEEALRESEVNLAMAQDIARIGSWAWDLEKDKLTWSDELYRILGLVPQSVTPSADLYMGYVHPDDKEHVQADIDFAKVKGSSSIEERLVLKDGSIVYTLVVTRPIFRDGKLVRIYGVVQDITQRKRVEEALKKSEEKYRELGESANSIILQVDRNLNIKFANEFALQFFGYTMDEIIGKNVVSTIIPARDTMGRYLAAMANDIVKHPEAYRLNVHENMRKNGELVWVSWTNKAIFDREGNVVEILSIGNDITKLKQAEEELQDAKARAELYLDLMGHDINNLHQVALGYLELARDMPAGEEQAMFLDKPVEVLQRSAQLIQNVRKLQKLRDGVFKTELVDVCKALSDVQGEFGAVPNKYVMLNINGYERCFVRANELLHDVFANLVSNAIKHTGDRADIVVDLDAVKDNGSRYYRVMVEDNGPGIPDDFKPKIFNRTLKGTNSARGMGLGLYLVKSLVDSYGGRVWVEDRIFGDHTKGAKFVVMLPAVDEQAHRP